MRIYLPIRNRGLADALLQGGPVSSFVQLATEGNLCLLPSGPPHYEFSEPARF